MEVERPQPQPQPQPQPHPYPFLQSKSSTPLNHSSLNQSPDDSKQTYTALIFNDKNAFSKQAPIQPRQMSIHKDKSAYILDSIKIQSLTKAISNKDIRNSLTLFENTKLNSTVDKKKLLQRPASAQTKNIKDRQEHIYSNLASKQNVSRQSRQLSLMGKNCFSEVNMQKKDKAINQKNIEEKLFSSKRIQKYKCKEESRFKSGKSINKHNHTQIRQSKRSLRYDQFINFQSLYKTLLINSSAITNTKISNKNKNPYLYKKQHKYSFHKQQKNKENTKDLRDTIIINCQKKQTAQSQTKIKIYANSRSFIACHKNMKPRTSDILNSMKKGKDKIQKIEEMNKTQVFQPQLYIQNIPINPKREKSNQRRPYSAIPNPKQQRLTHIQQLNPTPNSISSNESTKNYSLMQCKGLRYN